MSDSVLQRVINEKKELDANLEKLSAFIKSDTFQNVDKVSSTQAKLLIRQQNAMENYSDILNSRIEDFQAQEAAED